MLVIEGRTSLALLGHEVAYWLSNLNPIMDSELTLEIHTQTFAFFASTPQLPLRSVRALRVNAPIV